MNINKELMSTNAQIAADFLKCLANPNRLMVLCALMDGELSVSELNDSVPLSQSALSQHLSVLRDAELVETRREAQTIFYRLKDARVAPILHALYDLFCAGQTPSQNEPGAQGDTP